MKSPAEVSARLLKQWLLADNREALLLSEDAWPVSVPIGRPTPALLTQRTDEVRAHLQRWRAVGVGEVVWEAMSFRGGLDPVQVPVAWRLRGVKEWVAASSWTGTVWVAPDGAVAVTTGASVPWIPPMRNAEFCPSEAKKGCWLKRMLPWTDSCR